MEKTKILQNRLDSTLCKKKFTIPQSFHLDFRIIGNMAIGKW